MISNMCCCMCWAAWCCSGCIGCIRSLLIFDTPDWMHSLRRRMQYVPLSSDIEMGSLEPLVDSRTETVPINEMKTVMDAAVKGNGEAIYAHLPDL